jgi:hypothetical protein
VKHLVLAAIAGCALAGCSGAPPAPQSSPTLSQLAPRLSLLPITERIQQDVREIKCGAPGGSGGYFGAGPHGEPFAQHQASTTCQYPGGSTEQLSDAWAQATASHLESAGITITSPGSFTQAGVRGLTWEYTSGAASGVLTLTFVPGAEDSYTVLANLVEYAPRS